MDVIDYSESFPGCIAAEGKGSEFLVLYRLDRPRKNLNGEICRYELEHRWLSMGCGHDRDQAWACVQGSEVTLWHKRDVDPAKGLFEQFRIV